VPALAIYSSPLPARPETPHGVDLQMQLLAGADRVTYQAWMQQCTCPGNAQEAELGAHTDDADDDGDNGLPPEAIEQNARELRSVTLAWHATQVGPRRRRSAPGKSSGVLRIILIVPAAILGLVSVWVGLFVVLFRLLDSYTKRPDQGSGRRR
jgi:hypothetical protein